MSLAPCLGGAATEEP